jgi:hypothetical protein
MIDPVASQVQRKLQTMHDRQGLRSQTLNIMNLHEELILRPNEEN